jgi:nitrite reductase (NADH) large subunit
MIVVSAGIRPNSEIGVRSGLTVGRAIVVDDHMRSVDDMNVYVVGECAQHRGQVYGLVAPLWEQAKVFADQITAKRPNAAYHGSKLATKLKVMGVELASMGQTEPKDEQDEVIQFSEPRRGVYMKLIVRDGRLVGGILMGDISKAAFLMQAFDRDSQLPEERHAMLFDLGGPPQKVTLDEMPTTAQVCNCNGVTKAAIGECVTAGNRTTKSVMAKTRAGMGCGSCKGLVDDLVNGSVAARPRRTLRYTTTCRQFRWRNPNWLKQCLIRACDRFRVYSRRSLMERRTPPANRRCLLCSARYGPANTKTSAMRVSLTTAYTATFKRMGPSR